MLNAGWKSAETDFDHVQKIAFYIVQFWLSVFLSVSFSVLFTYYVLAAFLPG